MEQKMYLHIGNGHTVRQKDVIGIFDLDTSTVSPITRRYLSSMEKSGKAENVKEEIPKSFVLLGKENKKRGAKEYKVYIAQLSSKAILGRTK